VRLPKVIKSFKNYRGVATTLYPTLVITYFYIHKNKLLYYCVDIFIKLLCGVIQQDVTVQGFKCVCHE
jgi:hypothetical protein